jgi:hypothetical protein
MGNGFCVVTVHYHQQENKKTIWSTAWAVG